MNVQRKFDHREMHLAENNHGEMDRDAKQFHLDINDPRRDPYCAADASKQDENCDENGDIEHGYRVDTKREIKERKKRKREGDKKERIYE